MKLQDIVSDVANLESSSEDLQNKLFLQFGEFKRERSILHHRIGDDVFDSEVLVVRLHEHVVHLEMHVFLGRMPESKVTVSGSLGEQGVHFSDLLVELYEVSSFLETIKLIHET